MKKYLLTFLTLGLLLCEALFSGGGMVFAFDKDNYTYTIISSSAPRTVSIAAKSGATFSGSVSLPLSVTYNSNSYSVVAITASGFSGKTGITSITIPNTVTTINNSAFSGCTGITSVTFSGTSKVATIGDNAFDGCSKLKTCSLPASLTTIGSYAFRGCAFTSVTIPKNVTQMKTGVYLGCTSLTSVTWNAINCANYAKSGSGPYSFSSPFYYKTTTNVVTTVANQINKITFGSEVEHIPAYLCYYMTNLTEVTIPASVTSLGSGEDKGFGGCANIQKVVWNATNCTSASSPFSGSKINLTSFEFGSNVQNIPASLCNGYDHLTKILLPATVTNIAASAFSGCTALDTIVSFNTTHPTVANANAFNNVSVGCNVVVPNVSEYSGQTGWNHFTSLSTTISGNCGKTTPTEVTWEMDLSNGRLTISGTGTGAMKTYSSTNHAPWYDYRDYITEIIIEEGVKSIGSYAFYNCMFWTRVNIPESLTTFEGSAFDQHGTVNNREVIYQGDASGWAQITFGGTSYTSNPAAVTHGLKDKNGTLMTNVTISAPTIKAYAFYNNEALTSVTFTNDVTQILKNAFLGCTGLTTITIPQSLTSSSEGAFSLCSNLTSVVWNAENCSNYSYSYNGSSYSCSAPFYGIASQITSFTFGENVTRVPDNICRGMTGLTSITIPRLVTNFGSSAFTGCSNIASVTWNAENCAWSSTSSPFSASKAKITSFTLGTYVQTIPQYLCYQMTNLSFASITIPQSVTSIGTNAFSGCSNLKYITWNATNCGDFTSSTAPFDPIKTQIRTFTFGIGVQHIPAYLCYGMNNSNFTTITIPSSVTNIGSSAFYSCTHIATINYNAANISNYSTYGNSGNSGATAGDMFNYCGTEGSGIALNIGNAVEHIPNYIFYPGDSYGNIGIGAKITSIQFAENAICSSIGASAFKGISSLRTLQLPANMSTIGTDAFNSCPNIETITSKATTPPTLSSSFPSSSSITLYLPHDVAAKSTYRAASGWSSFTEANTFPKIVQFSLNGKSGDAIDPQFFDNTTSKASAPSDPADDDYYVFDKWCSDEEGENPFNFSSTDITADQTLYAKWGLNGTLTLSDAEDNSTKLADYNGQTVDVNLSRTIRHESYNTFCLPFSLTAEQVEDKFGTDCDIEEMTEAAFHGESLDLVFEKKNAIEAGKPYLIQPTATVVDPSFSGVTISNNTLTSQSDFIDFKGVFSPTELEHSENLLFLGAGNSLYMSSGGTMNGLRAYFELKNSSAQQAAAKKRVRLSFNNSNTATDLETVTSDVVQVIGRKFIQNGQLYIEQNGRTYNAQGVLVK